MSDFVTVKAGDGHELSAYVAKPEGTPVGALVVVQEIFGVNAHIRSVADGYAKDGYLCIAPALFDRFERGVELKYDGTDGEKAYELYAKLKPETTLLDVAAAFDHVRGAHNTGVVGYCYGGFTAWLAATRGKANGIDPACTVGYYAGGIGSVATEEPNCPVLLHFGGKDSHIGQDQVDAVKAAHDGHGDVTIYVYPEAEHGFNCDARGSYNPEAAKLARERSLAFLKEHIG